MPAKTFWTVNDNLGKVLAGPTSLSDAEKLVKNTGRIIKRTADNGVIQYLIESGKKRFTYFAVRQPSE